MESDAAMKPDYLLLQLRCVMARINPVPWVAISLCATGLACAGLWIPHLRQELAERRDELEKMEQLNRAAPHVQVPVLSQNELRAQKFYDNLGRRDYAEQQLKAMFAIAAKKNLMLNEGEYKSGEDRNSGIVAYQIQLPVSGPYPAIREFCEEVLVTIPFASLDQISFKREMISKNNLEATLRFTLYLDGGVKAVQP